MMVIFIGNEIETDTWIMSHKFYELIRSVRNEELIDVSLLLSPAAVRVNISVSRDSDDDEWRLLSDYIFTPRYKSFLLACSIWLE